MTKPRRFIASRDPNLGLCTLLFGVAIVLCGASAESADPQQSVDLVVVARLDSIAQSPPCGIFHFGAVAEYSDISVLQGDYTKSNLYVVHGCPELAREMYSKDAGDLTSFRPGDYHRLTLTKENVHNVSVVKSKRVKDKRLFYCKHVIMHRTLDANMQEVPAN